MTREEAIAILHGDNLNRCSEKENEALDMAIQALEQEPTFDDECQKDMDEAWEQIQKKRKRIPVTLDLTPCDDAISRQAVLDKTIRKNSIWNSITNSEGKNLEEIIFELPSVTQRSGKWIPVSERLPEEAFGCLVTILDTDLRTQDEFENILPYTVGYDGETWNNFCGEPIPFEVIAWMPLPKPYEPQESEDKE